jgi:hypothetical protein
MCAASEGEDERGLRTDNGKSKCKNEMRGFFLPQPASWPGTPFAALRMTNKNRQRQEQQQRLRFWLRQNDDG